MGACERLELLFGGKKTHDRSGNDAEWGSTSHCGDFPLRESSWRPGLHPTPSDSIRLHCGEEWRGFRELENINGDCNYANDPRSARDNIIRKRWREESPTGDRRTRRGSPRGQRERKGGKKGAMRVKCETVPGFCNKICFLQSRIPFPHFHMENLKCSASFNSVFSAFASLRPEADDAFSIKSF